MPFSLVNFSATLLKEMRIFLEGIENVEIFVDDVIIYNEIWERHLKPIEEVLQRFRKARIMLQPSKCSFGKEIEFIGYIIKRGSISPNHDNNSKIAKAARLKMKKQVQAFLGLTGYYRNNVPNYPGIAVPLSDLTNKG